MKKKKETLKLYADIKDTKKSKEKRRDTLHEYREYLESLKIVDPACGSGAFLTACFRYLLDEHKWIQRELAKADAGLFDYHDIDKQIIEKNLFGVDINGASVGIAKLSLWLQTAKRDRPLSNLMGNIKSANSLTTDWGELFPEIMANGGFDCVIGNPPYGASFSKEDKNLLKEIYKTIYKGKFDSYHFFIQRGVEILKKNGLIGYIIPDTWVSLQQAEKLRKFILNNYIICIQHHSFFIFDDAKIDSLNLIIQKNNKINTDINIEYLNKDMSIDKTKISQNRFLNNDNLIINYLTNDNDANLLNKIKKDKSQIKDFCEWSQGLVPYSREGQSEEIVSTRGYHTDYKKDETYKKELAGKDISKYTLEWNGQVWISYGDWLHRPRPQKYFTSPRILVQRIRGRMGDSIVATYTEEEYYNNPSLSNFISLEKSNIDLKFILAILNSKMINWYFQNIFFDDMNIKPTDLEKLPIPNIPKEKQEPFINLVDTIIDSKEKIAKYNKHFDSLNAVDKIEIKEEIEKLESLVLSSVDEIDSLVYELYGLSGDEIQIVEGN